MPYERLEIPGPAAGRNQGPPYFGDPQPCLYGLLAVEVAPGKIAYYHLELDYDPGACTIDMDREPRDFITDDLLQPRMFGPWRISATIRGTVVSDRPDYRPPTRVTPQPALPAYMVDVAYVASDPDGSQ